MGKTDAILKENQSYYDVQDYLLGRIIEAANKTPLHKAISEVKFLSEVMSEVESLNSVHPHEDRTWKYTITDWGADIQIKAESNTQIRYITRVKGE